MEANCKFGVCIPFARRCSIESIRLGPSAFFTGYRASPSLSQQLLTASGWDGLGQSFPFPGHPSVRHSGPDRHGLSKVIELIRESWD